MKGQYSNAFKYAGENFCCFFCGCRISTSSGGTYTSMCWEVMRAQDTPVNTCANLARWSFRVDQHTYYFLPTHYWSGRSIQVPAADRKTNISRHDWGSREMSVSVDGRFRKAIRAFKLIFVRWLSLLVSCSVKPYPGSFLQERKWQLYPTFYRSSFRSQKKNVLQYEKNFIFWVERGSIKQSIIQPWGMFRELAMLTGHVNWPC